VCSDLEAASKYVTSLEVKTHEQNQTSLELQTQLGESKDEVDTLMNYVRDLKQRINVYIPVQTDSVDKKLAEQLNSYQDHKLKLMFCRVSEGVYKFGNKKVYVKVDQDKIRIRVGGGYLSLDEFIEQQEKSPKRR
jgi:uncharacterized coiled-coil protein SlyX